MAKKSQIKVDRVSIDEIHKMNDVVFIDARSATALSRNPFQVQGAIHVPVKEVEQRLRQLPRNRTLITYCT
jgi:rhodanese-related sulfurtransferase